MLIGVSAGAALALALFGFGGLGASHPSRAGADKDTATDDLPAIIAYSGTVTLAGKAYDGGTLDLRFTLWDSSGFALWTETDTGVEVASDGHFSLLLGAVTPLTDAALTSGAVELGIEVRQKFGSWTELGGRQALGTLPRAQWLQAAAAMSVSKSATVTGTMSFGGSVTYSGNSFDVGAGQARVDLGTAANGPHGFAFGDTSGTGAQLVYRTSPNSLIVEATNDFSDGTNLWASTLGSGDLDTAGAATFPSTVAVGDDLTVSPPATASAGLDLVGGDLLLGKNASGDKYVAFKESTSGEGMELRYNAGGNAFEVESGTALSNSTDLFTVDADDSHTYLKGTFTMSKLVLDPGDDFTSTKTLESDSADKTFYADTNCPTGAIAGGVNGSNQGMLCVCLNSAEKTHGWYCWE
ncbi:MAG: hypothetical protein U1F43_21180 [Myxococcota bacterium]